MLPEVAIDDAPPRPGRLAGWRATRTILWGLLAGALVLAGGWIGERRALGPTDASALQHVADDAARAFAQVAASLERAAQQLASDTTARQLAEGDAAARGALFDRAAHVLRESPEVDALAIHEAGGRALAWAGRPSSLPGERLSGPAALFVAPGGLGLRLIHVRPIPGEGGRRAGVVVAEARLTRDGLPRPSGARLFGTTAAVPLGLRASYEGAGEQQPRHGFLLRGPDGRPLLTAEVAPAALAAARASYRTAARSLALLLLAITLSVVAMTLRDAQERATRTRPVIALAGGIVACAVAARTLLALAVPADWRWTLTATGPFRYPWLGSPVDVLATALLAMALVVVAFDLIERSRVSRPRRRVRVSLWATLALTGVVAGVVLSGHARLLAGLVRLGQGSVSLTRVPLDAAQLALVTGVLCANAAVIWLAVTLIRLAGTVSPVRRDEYIRRLAAAVAFATVALAIVATTRGAAGAVAMAPPVVLIVVAAATARWVLPRYRHSSQAARLTVAYLALTLPAFAFYPSTVADTHAAIEAVIEQQYAEEALAHRERLRQQLGRSQQQIDAIADLAGQLAAAAPGPDAAPDPAPAFHLWSQTELGRQRLTSSLELYAPSGDLVSRFALNLPAEFLATERPVDTDCAWDVFGEALAATDDQVLLHAGRAVCLPDGTRVGTVLVHVVLDYGTLPFVADLDPAGALVRAAGGAERTSGDRAIAFAVYGWGRTPVYPTAGTAWPISASLLQRIYHREREPFWEELHRGDRRYRVYLNNDRAGIYAIGYALPRPIDHAVALAEIATLSGLAFVAILALLGTLGRLAGRSPSTGRALLREVRRSFYRKLFLLFVLASIVPVLALAVVTRNYLAGQLREGLESGAVRTASAARRVIETVVSQQRRDQRDPVVAVTDEIMVSVSRIIDQDVNIYVRDTLAATSQRDLFAAGLLSARIPAEVARAISLERQSSYVGDERLGGFEYTLAAVPVRDGDSGAVLTVPLTLRQQEIENEVAALDRRVVLAGVLFILLGAAIGYVTAERLGDPIQRLTRAAGRIARGDLDARITTAPADELGRLVDAFNQMAADLQRQRAELERTNRLAAWADMARQVAHDIKNPLTPIQLSAEFLRRVHDDGGAPLGPVVDKTTATILSQVTLLRQIASEFSSFASSPVARFAPTDLGDVLQDVLDPYETGLPSELTLDVRHDASVPLLQVDRGLLARALVNVIENALHAMRGGGTLRVQTAPYQGGAQIVVTDTGVGMDADALARLFEPYFSTKATGTGLGLTIARRNVELNGGTIAVASERGVGTTVTISLPARAPEAGAGGSSPRR
jgi:signal transduction histidine kinase